LKLPRDLDYRAIVKALSSMGYTITRLTTEMNGQHHITIPAHRPVKIGTLNAIIIEVAEHFKITKNELMLKIFPE
jgi:hypothetical protein